MCEIETKTKTESVLVHLIGKVCVQRECRTFILTEPKISSIIFKAARSVSTWLLSFLWSCHQLSPDAGNYWKCWKHVASCKVALIHPSELNTPFTSVKPRNLHDYSACQASAIKHKMQKGSDLKKKKKTVLEKWKAAYAWVRCPSLFNLHWINQTGNRGDCLSHR